MRWAVSRSLRSAGSTLTNAATSQIDVNGHENFIGTASPLATNTFTNAGVIGPLPTGDFGNGFIEFAGNTAATNTGIISQDLVFTNFGPAGGMAPMATATFNFGQGSVLTGDINNPDAVFESEFGSTAGLAALTVNFQNSGAYPGNVYGVTATNKTGAGRWILTGNSLALGNAMVSGGTLQFGVPNRADADALLESGTWDPYFNLVNPLAGNTAVNAALNPIAAGLSSNVILAPAGTRIVTSNITIGANGAVVGDTLFIGDIVNNGSYLAGYMLPSDATLPLGNLLDNQNQVLPGHDEISGSYTQGSTGTLVTNFAPTVNRPERQLVGTQAELFAPASFWLTVAPFAPDLTPSTLTTVDGAATVGGTVKVFVNKGGLYVNGDSRDILTSAGAPVRHGNHVAIRAVAVRRLQAGHPRRQRRQRAERGGQPHLLRLGRDDGEREGGGPGTGQRRAGCRRQDRGEQLRLGRAGDGSPGHGRLPRRPRLAGRIGVRGGEHPERRVA